jgi:predicted nuclease of predicted toxin-antitoxin system
MFFLLDNCTSPTLKGPLELAGHDVVHVQDIGQGNATDTEILETARQLGRIVITQDRDFSNLLAGSGAATPSVIYLRLVNRRPANQAQAILTHLPAVRNDLLAGAIVVLTDMGCRVRPLPIP